MAMRLLSDEVPKGLAPALLPGERLVTAVHSHWATLWKPALICSGLFVVTVFVDLNLTASTQPVGNALWIVWFASLAWGLWKFLEWRHDWFVATDKRLLRRYGLITHKVAMMPLIKVTDMSYNRTIPGKVLGYGQFVMESAGQDQALRTIDWVPNSDFVYRAICAEIFHIAPASKAPAAEVEIEDDGTGDGPPVQPTGGSGGSRGPGGPGSGGRGLGGGWRPGRLRRPTGGMGYPDVPPVHNPVQDRLQGYSRPIPVRNVRGGEPLYESDDISRRRRGDDTGPIPIRPKHEPRTD